MLRRKVPRKVSDHVQRRVDTGCGGFMLRRKVPLPIPFTPPNTPAFPRFLSYSLSDLPKGKKSDDASDKPKES